MLKPILFLLCLALAVIVGVSIGTSNKAGSTAASVSPVYDRVLASGQIRCGYGFWEPALSVDPTTNKISGIFYDYMMALGAALDLEIVWAEEVPWGDFPTALATGRIDAMCTGIWPSPSRNKVMDYVQPIYYLPFNAFVRADDTRFDENLKIANHRSYTFTMTDGEHSSIIAQSHFPAAEYLSLPQLSDISQNFWNVVNKKADIYLNDVVSYYEFNEQNPDLLRIVPTPQPLKVFGNAVAIPNYDEKFRRMLENTTNTLILDGTIDRILDQYERYPGSFQRVNRPYQN